MRLVLPALLSLCAAACTLQGDPPTPPIANPLGNGLRIAQVQDPRSPDYHPNQNSAITSAVVTWHDTFDETMDGKSVGTLYVQDLTSSAPYAGIGLFETNFIPASLDPLPGDVLDLSGPYQESTGIGTAVFNPGTFLPQLSKPVGTYRYEYVLPAPAQLSADDLDEGYPKADSNFAKGRQWLGMLATIKDVVVAAGSSSKNRVTYQIENASGGVTPNGPAISNELYDLRDSDFPAGTHFKSVTGIVTWFYSFHIAPRYPADLVQ